MRKYYYNARDVAAYFKYFSVPSHLEVSYMQYIFNLGKHVLAEPLTRDFEHFKDEVYRELYFLWSNGFDGEKSDISAMVADGQLSQICDKECINLESYMKLICLHLIFSGNMPYINLNFYGLMLSLGVRCDIEVFERNVRSLIGPLQIVVFDCFGKEFDLALGVPDELLRVALNEDFKNSLTNSDFKESLRLEQLQWLKDLKDASFKIFGQIPARKKTTPNRKSSSAKAVVTADTQTNEKYSSTAAQLPKHKVQPKGAPARSKADSHGTKPNKGKD